MKDISNKRFRFSAVLSPVKASFITAGVYLPDAIIKQLPTGRVRVEGILNDVPFSLAVRHIKNGRYYLTVSAPLRKAAGIRLGDHVEVRFTVVDPDKIDVPEELSAVLMQDVLAYNAWNTLTTGYQRSLIHYVTAVKNVDSRIQRSFKLMEKVKADFLCGKKNKT